MLQTNELLLGDSFELIDSVDEASVDMVLEDMPYNTTSNSWDKQIDLKNYWNSRLRILKPNGVVVLTASQPFTSLLVTSCQDLFRHEWIWIKNRGSNFANTVREPFKEHESILVFSRGKWTYNKQMQERAESGKRRADYKLNYNSQSENYRVFEGRQEQTIGTLRVPSSWQKFNVETGLHPTQKPVPLFEYLIKTYSNEGDLIFDGFAGSGTTAIASFRLGRNFIAIEQKEEYYQKAKARFENERTIILN